jgi:hypothetical protein
MATWLSSVGVDDRVVICTVAGGEILFGLERLAQGRCRTELEEKDWNLFAVLPCEPIRQPLVICMRISKSPNSAAACRLMRTTSG